MSLSELFQMIQFFIILLYALIFVCSVVRCFQFSYTFVKHIKDKKYSQSDILFIRSLYLVTYECFHKYLIWRYFRLSW